MTTPVAERTLQAILAAPGAAEDAIQGWYFYGVARRGSLAAGDDGDQTLAAPYADMPLQLLEFAELAAVVRPVVLADFSMPALRDCLRDASALEAAVRSHNRVIEAVHAQRAILPARFGTVYTSAEDIVSALRLTREALLDRLQRVEGCDEWAVHVFADRAAVRERTAVADPAIRRLHNERSAARPGRAYFLEQQLREAVETVTEQALLTIAQTIFDRLTGYAVVGRVIPVAPAADCGEVEILRAAFLVARDVAPKFDEEVRSAIDAGEGIRCEASGPWAPYSFTACDDEEAV